MRLLLIPSLTTTMSTDADSIPSFDVVASDTDFTVEGQTVLILCGLIASGKVSDSRCQQGSDTASKPSALH